MASRTIRTAAAAAALLVLSMALTPAVADEEPPHVFVYSGTAGFRHLSIEHAKQVLAGAAEDSGAFTVEFNEDPASLGAETLSRADVVVWLSSTGSTSPFSDAQERDYEAWVSCGGGHVGIHASTDTWHDGTWPAWEELTGAFFSGHPLTAGSILDDQFKDPAGAVTEGDLEPEATIGVAAPDHPATQAWAGEDTFLQHDEFYYYDRDPGTVMSDYQALLTFEGFTNPADAAVWGRNYPAHMPVSWAGSFRGLNRTFYTNIGHGIATWDSPEFLQHVVAGILWTAGFETPDDCD